MAEFIKHNSTAFPDALIREAEGLRLLAGALADAGETGLRVPEIRRLSETELVLPRIGDGRESESHMATLGRGLARMHRQIMPYYGLDTDNLIGLSRQPNACLDDWGAFFLDFRLRPQLAMIVDPSVRAEFETQVEACAAGICQFLNRHCDHASLLHGDLWAGNVLFDANGPWLIDPAAYYGDREADLAMTELFGGFAPAFYHAYDSVYPRSDVYERKRPVYNLYHTLNHYNLFGAPYLGACRKNLSVLGELS